MDKAYIYLMITYLVTAILMLVVGCLDNDKPIWRRFCAACYYAAIWPYCAYLILTTGKAPWNEDH